MPEVLADLPARLKAAAADVADAKGAWEHALKLRDELVVQAVDEGMTQRQVAKLIGVHFGRITPILAGSQPDVTE